MSNPRWTRSPRVLGPLALTMIAGIAAPALAGAPINVMAQSGRSQTLQTTIAYSDLNLASAQGQAVLERRISMAADDVCGATALYSIDAKSDYLRCRSEAISGAREQVMRSAAAGGAKAIRLTAG